MCVREYVCTCVSGWRQDIVAFSALLIRSEGNTHGHRGTWASVVSPYNLSNNPVAGDFLCLNAHVIY